MASTIRCSGKGKTVDRKVSVVTRSQRGRNGEQVKEEDA